MTDGDGWDSAEAGPSWARWEDKEAPLLAEAEEVLIPLPARRARSNTTSTAPTLASQASFSPTSPSRRPVAAAAAAPARALRPLSLNLGSLHTSASDVFASPTRLDRPTTYSSLPPSPRDEAYAAVVGAERGLGIRELDDVLACLERRCARDDAQGSGDAEPVAEMEEAERKGREAYEDGQEGDDEHEDFLEALSGADDRHMRLDSPNADEGDAEGEALVQKRRSVWELLVDDDDEWDTWVADGKWERISNFLAVPLAVERTTLFGALLCLDLFLYNFTLLPLRAGAALLRLVRTGRASRAGTHAVMRAALLVVPTAVLLAATDASKMYHTVRGQDTIKLYVIFNALEIGDRLCCAFGQDVLDTLFARETLTPGRRKREHARPVFFFALSLAYVLTHTLIYFYMLVSLNVAINSYDYTLLSLLISNQFVEIKGSVFKKFEKENLFQIMCADIVERFQLGLMLVVIALRNMIEMAGSDLAFLPKSYVKGKSLVETILSPVLFVLVSEMVVDWLKHAFITKFNHVRATVYGRFTDVLAKDVLMAGGRKGSNITLDQSPLVARRLGFAAIPLACLVVRIAAQVVGMLASRGWAVWAGVVGIGLCGCGCLIALKVLLGLSLLSYAVRRQAGMEQREAEDAVNDFARHGIGESKEEMEYNKHTRRYLSRAEDLPAYASPRTAPTNTPRGAGAATPHAETPRTATGTATPRGDGRGAGGGRSAGGADKKRLRLEEIERWTMVKRIW
ncbi:hypothetical protein Q5752_005676 [Cryptotrichosporon argae]